MKKGTRRKHDHSCMCRCGRTERNTLRNLSGRHLECGPENIVSWVRKKKTQGEKLVRQFLNKWTVSSHEPHLYDSKCQVANGLWIGIDGHSTCLPSLQKDNSKASHTVRLCFSCPQWSQTYCLLGLSLSSCPDYAHKVHLPHKTCTQDLFSSKNSKWVRDKGL